MLISALPQGSGFSLQSFAEKAKGFSLQSLTRNIFVMLSLFQDLILFTFNQ